MPQTDTVPPEQVATSLKRVLNVGSGPVTARRLHPAFSPDAWSEVRLDISPDALPDVVGSITTLTASFAPESFDAIWASHILEHLYAHDVPLALSQVRTILKPDGFAVITSPDLEAAAELLIEHGLDHVAYFSGAGPITVHDILFGHSASITRGQHYMAHKTGFTCAALGQRMLDAGFPTVLAKTEKLDLWAVALMDKADTQAIQAQLKNAGIDMSDDGHAA